MPSIAITRPYEAVYIVDPDLGSEQIEVITNRYKQLVESNGGAVSKIDVWERRKLAYPVQGRTEGIYVIMQFSSTANVEAELRRIFQISEDQIRSLIVKQEDVPPLPDAEAGAPQANLSPAPAPAPPAPAADPVPAPFADDEPAPAAAEEAPVPQAVTTPEAPTLAPEQTD